MGWIGRQDVEQKEIDNLHPEFGIYKDVVFDDIKYFRDDDTGNLWEIKYCYNDTWENSRKALEKLELNSKKRELLKSFGF